MPQGKRDKPLPKEINDQIFDMYMGNYTQVQIGKIFDILPHHAGRIINKRVKEIEIKHKLKNK